MDSFQKFNGSYYSTEQKNRILTKVDGEGYGNTAYGGLPMYIDGQHHEIYEYEFKMLKGSGLAIAIEEGRNHTDKTLYESKSSRYHVLFDHDMVWETGTSAIASKSFQLFSFAI